MSGSATKRMIRAYQENQPVTQFLTGMFQAPPINFYDSKTVEIDIERSDEDVAIVLQDLSTGYRTNSTDIFTNKEFLAPVFKESATLNAFDLLNRAAGQNPFASNDFQAKATVKAFSAFRAIEKKIRRSIELQSSQVLQTGIVTLTDASGTALYTLDYKPKATHFPTAGTAWSSGGDPIGDLGSLAEVIREDGKIDPDQIIMGVDAWNAFIANAAVLAVFDNRRLNTGSISPMVNVGEGGRFRGTVDINNYKFDVFTYGGKYKDPVSGNVLNFIEGDKVIMKASAGRMDATFGAIPKIVQPDSRVLKFLPGRISGQNIDLHTNAWISPDGENLMVGVGSRPLMIPTAIDTYGCIDVTP